MKSLVAFIVLVTILFSCSKEADELIEFESDEYPQKWELVRITGQLVGSVWTGGDMQWQEYYLLKSDSTFLRWRVEGDQEFEEEGTFSVKETEFEELMMILTYDNANDLVGSCYGSKTKETLDITSNTKMQNTWNACDGPGWEYKRVE